jgi:hypothetical protein
MPALSVILDARLKAPPQGTPLPACPTNLPMNTLLGRALMLKASGPGDYEVQPGKPLRLMARWWAMIPDSATDEDTGEISEFIRVVLFDADGKSFRTSAAHAPSRLRGLLELVPSEEWQNGVALIIEQRRGKRGRDYHDINLDVGDRYGLKGE